MAEPQLMLFKFFRVWGSTKRSRRAYIKVGKWRLLCVQLFHSRVLSRIFTNISAKMVFALVNVLPFLIFGGAIVQAIPAQDAARSSLASAAHPPVADASDAAAAVTCTITQNNVPYRGCPSVSCPPNGFLNSGDVSGIYFIAR